MSFVSTRGYMILSFMYVVTISNSSTTSGPYPKRIAGLWYGTGVIRLASWVAAKANVHVGCLFRNLDRAFVSSEDIIWLN